MKRAWCLCLLVFLLLLVGSEGSKFKQLYPDYKDYQFQQGQSKANKWKADKSENPLSESGHPTTTPKEHQHSEHQHTEHHPHSPTQIPLPSQIDYVEYIVAIAVGALLVFFQIWKLNKEYKQPNKRTKTEPLPNSTETPDEEFKEKETEQEQEDEIGKEGGRQEERGKEEEPKEENERAQKQENEVAIEKETENLSRGNEGKEEEPKEESETVRHPEKVQEEINEIESGKDESEEKVDEITVEKCIVVSKEVERSGDGKADSDEDWIVVSKDRKGRAKSDVEEPEIDDEFEHAGMQLEPYGAKDPMPQLSTMLEKLQISVGPETPLKHKLQVAELIQKEKKLIIQQAQFTTNLSYKRRSLELQTLKEERSRQKELVRQNSIKEEIYLQQIKNDEYHKKIILHGSALLILGIWLKVMDFNLFTLPSLFLSPSSPASYLPSSLSSLYALASWLNPTRLFYGLGLFVVFTFLWMYVSSLAPYVVLLVAFMHAWQSLFRAGAYFFLLWVCAGGTFALARRIGVLRRNKALKLVILYLLNLFAAGIVGSVVAHGDPLNPYRIHFVPDIFAEQLLAHLY